MKKNQKATCLMWEIKGQHQSQTIISGLQDKEFSQNQNR